MEKRYTREEIFEILNDEEKFEKFCQEDSNPVNYNYNDYNIDSQSDPNYSSYDRYLSHNNDNIVGGLTVMVGDKLQRAPNPFMGRNVPKISRDEYQLLEFCHNTDMISFLREEFRRNPISREDAQRSHERMVVESFNRGGLNANDFKKNI